MKTVRDKGVRHSLA